MFVAIGTIVTTLTLSGPTSESSGSKLGKALISTSGASSFLQSSTSIVGAGRDRGSVLSIRRLSTSPRPSPWWRAPYEGVATSQTYEAGAMDTVSAIPIPQTQQGMLHSIFQQLFSVRFIHEYESSRRWHGQGIFEDNAVLHNNRGTNFR